MFRRYRKHTLPSTETAISIDTVLATSDHDFRSVGDSVDQLKNKKTKQNQQKNTSPVHWSVLLLQKQKSSLLIQTMRSSSLLVVSITYIVDHTCLNFHGMR